MGRTNREWFQGGLHGTKPQTSPAPVIYKQIPWGQLHSAGTHLLSARRKQKTIFFLVSETPLSAQGMCHCSFGGLPIRLLLSQLLAPPLQSSQDPKNQRATGAHLLHTQLCAQHQLNTSLHVKHFPHSLFICQILLVVSVSHKKKKTHCSHCRWLIRPGCKHSS